MLTDNEREERDRLRVGASIRSSEAQAAQASAQKKLADAQDEQVKLQKSIKTATWCIVFFTALAALATIVSLFFPEGCSLKVIPEVSNKVSGLGITHCTIKVTKNSR